MRIVLDGLVEFVPYNAKIADITHADTDKHFLDLATALTETRKIIAVSLRVNRITGTGSFNIYNNEGLYGIFPVGQAYSILIIIADGTQRLQYAIGVANDDWDVYCLGYVVEGS